VLAPIRDPGLVRSIRDGVLKTYLADNVKARQMNAAGTYTRKKAASGKALVNSQEWFLERRTARGRKKSGA